MGNLKSQVRPFLIGKLGLKATLVVKKETGSFEFLLDNYCLKNITLLISNIGNHFDNSNLPIEVELRYLPKVLARF